MMLAHTRHRTSRVATTSAIVRVGADPSPTVTKPFGNKYMNIGMIGAGACLLFGQFLPAAILLGSALGASAMSEAQ